MVDMDSFGFDSDTDLRYASDEDSEISTQLDQTLSLKIPAMPFSPIRMITPRWYPSTLVCPLVQETLQYRFAIMTPRMPHTAGVANPFIDSWFPLSLNIEFLFSAIIMSSLSHKRAKFFVLKDPLDKFTTQDQKLLEDSYKASVRALNGTLRTPTSAATDAAILAVLLMIEMPFVSPTKDWRKESPFQAPLQGLQWLNIHGARDPNLSHQMGLCKLVKLRGGLRNIELPGLAPAISYRVLVNAALTLSQPCLPYHSLSGIENVELENIIDTSPTCPEFQFSDLYSLCFSGEIINTFRALAVYTCVLKRYISGDPAQMDNQTLCDWRNIIQHRVLSLPCRQDKNSPSIEHEVIRICLFIYSIGVTFPLPGPSAPFAPLAGILLSNLQYSKFEFGLFRIPECRDLFLWVLTMGCIAATDSSERSWFIEKLRAHTLAEGIVNWTQYKTILKKYLWLDLACDMAGKLLWNEIQTSVGLQVSNSQPVILESRLPCGQCQARKIKCDKLSPCDNCVRGGYKCSQSIPSGNIRPPRVQIYSSRKRPCELCRQRKVKCNKQHPCQNCTKGDFTCVYLSYSRQSDLCLTDELLED